MPGFLKVNLCLRIYTEPLLSNRYLSRHLFPPPRSRACFNTVVLTISECEKMSEEKSEYAAEVEASEPQLLRRRKPAPSSDGNLTSDDEILAKMGLVQ